MPSSTAKRLCPDGCFVRPSMDAYRDESQRIVVFKQAGMR